MEPTALAGQVLQASEAVDPHNKQKRPVHVLSAFQEAEELPVQELLGVVPVPPGSMVGLELLQNEAQDLLIVVDVVKGGLWSEWNEQHPEHMVEPGDRILSVNGSCSYQGAWAELTCQSAEDRTMNMLIQKPTENRIQFYKLEGEHLGLFLIPLDNGLCFVESIVTTGVIHKWNAEHANRQVKTFDQLVEVNGRRGGHAELVQAMSESGDVELVLMTHRPKDC